MTSGKPIYYWDTSVLLTWIKNEARPNNEMDGVAEVADKIQKDHAILLTSAITDTEVLASTLNDVAKQRLHDLFKRRNCQKVNVDDRVSALASEIRDYYQKLKDVDHLPTLTTPDAIHLATAILYGAAEFHTFDEHNENRRRRALIPLSGNVAGHKLVICKPPKPVAVQLPLLESIAAPGTETVAHGGTPPAPINIDQDQAKDGTSETAR